MEHVRVCFQVSNDDLSVGSDNLILSADMVEETNLVTGGLNAAALKQVIS
jgi:hypothetical protein